MGATQHGLSLGGIIEASLDPPRRRLGAKCLTPQAASRGATLALYLQQTIHRHHVVIQVDHDDHRSEHDKTHDEDAKG